MMRFLLCLISVFFAAAASAGIISFSANPTTFLPGQEVTLSWSVSAGDSIAISPGVGAVSGATGSVVVIPSGTTTYTLTDSTSGTTTQATATQFAPPVLTHRWSFNEGSGTTVLDSVAGASGNGILRGTTFTRTASQVSLPGGASGSAPYIDLPNGIISSLNEVTIEGWMTLDGAQTWSRYFDFGSSDQTSSGGAAGELIGPGRPGGNNTAGLEYLTLSAQSGTNTAQRRLAFKHSGTEVNVDLTDSTVYGQQFHFAVTFNATGNNGQPQLRYYKDGKLVGQLNTSYRLQTIVDVNNWLGRSQFTGDANVNGSYNEFRLWNGPMTDSGLASSIADGPDTVPLVASFTAFPSVSIYSGTTVRLSYLLSGAGTTGSIDQGIGALSGTAGYVSVTPQTTTTYTLTTTNGGTPQTTPLTIVVVPGQPVSEKSAVTAGYQTATALTLIAHDPNTPLNQLTYTIVTPPAHGALSGTGTSRTFTPAAGYSGADSFTFKTNDGTADSNVATVSITVNPAPVAPTDLTLSSAALFTTYVGGSFAARLQAVDGNPDDVFTFTLVAGAGATNNNYFTISGNQLIAAHDFSGDLGQTVSVRLRVTDSTGNAFDKIVTLPVQAPARHVKINEINYNPSRNTLHSEFIELYNPLATAVDLSGWRFTKGVTFTFPGGMTIAPNGYVVIAQDPAIIAGLYGVTALGPFVGGLSSDGDDIVLRDAGGNIVDELNYGVSTPWPIPPNGDGPSLELLNPDLDSALGSNWRASTSLPTAFTFLAKSSGGWRYRKGTSEASSPITAWRAENFVEDASWLTGAAPIGLFKQNSNTPIAYLPEFNVTLGTQLTDMATFTSSFTAAYRSVFFRKTFTVPASIPRALLLRVMHNDASIVWINGQEVARFGFTPGAPTDPAFNDTNYYERANDPWSEQILLNAGALLHAGTNTIAIEGFAKLPAPRSAQEDLPDYNIFDFSIDAELKNPPELLGTPGAQNSVFAANAPPAIEKVTHKPDAPRSWEPITVNAKVSDPQGVGSVQLLYQTCAPGNFIPATLPYTAAQLVANPNASLQPNPAFESVANWTTVTMSDDGSVPGDIAGDGIFSGRIPAQPHRTLMRYRVVATDLAGASIRVPTADDPRKNFALFSYDGIPPYVANGQLFSPAALTSLPVYQWITRSQDFSAMLAYNASEQMVNAIDLNALLARHYEDWEGALVFNTQVIDHVTVRLRGGNSRYAGSGKRHFRFNFPKGSPLYAANERGELYPRPWEKMLFNKMFGNKGYYDFGITYEVGAQLWRQQGIPMPESHWVHFRVVQGAQEAPSATTGDFWGLYQALEFPDGKNFLRSRNLPLGNFYKMSDWTQNGEMGERYQSKDAPDFSEDYDNVRYNVHQTASQSFIETYVNMPLWYRYNAVQEAVRHYDIFTEPTGRHRMKNLMWYFEPQAGNWLGRLWFMPYDWDASFGPNFNSGYDVTHNAIYDHDNISDSPTWQLPKADRTNMKIQHRNAIRELRDLVWYRDGSTGRGPLDDMLDDALASISAFWPADRARWPATGAVGDYSAGAPAKVQDMKNFAFVGWTDVFNDGSPSVGAGGRATYLDSISDTLDAGQLPVKPTISYTGAGGYPVDGITLQSSAFSDPQPANTFSAIQWRVGEITDSTAPAYDASAARIFEVEPVWDSGPLVTTNLGIAVPGTLLRAGHAYRARVRHQEINGRWSHWSAPLQFIAGASNYLQVLKDNLMVAELMYHPATPNAAEAAAGFLENDFEYIELRNISPVLTLELGNVRLTKGVDYIFSTGSILQLPPGARVLIVKNIAAFTMRYGSGKPVTGTWDPNDNLANGGEEVKLSYGAGAAIQDFTYDNKSPWPVQADAGGYSLVLRAPETRPDHTKPFNWRASYVAGGTPGGDDRMTFAEWSAMNNVTSGTADDDGDGVQNLLEYVLRGNPHASDAGILPVAANQTITVGGVEDKYLTLTFLRALGSDEATLSVEWSPDLATWSTNGALVSSTDHGDGTVTEVWRAPQPTSAGKQFARLRATRP